MNGLDINKPEELLTSSFNIDEEELLERYAKIQDVEIERLLSQYGNSLSEVRELYPQLLGAVEKRRQTTLFPTQPLFFSASEAKEMGLALDEDWMLKFNPGKNDHRYTASFITPKKWEITESGLYISPEGNEYSKADIEALLSMPMGGLTTKKAPLGIESLTEQGQRLYGEYQAAGGELDASDWAKLKEQEYLETEQIFGAVFPKRDIEEVIAYAENNFEGFRNDLLEIGRTPEVEALLREMYGEVTPEQFDEFFGTTEEITTIPAPFKPESKIKDIWDAFYSGMARMWYQSKEYVLTTLPNKILGELIGAAKGKIPIVPLVLVTPPLWERKEISAPVEKWAESISNKLKQGYIKRKLGYEEWVKEHPELKPRAEWEGGTIEKIKENPRILLDPAYIGYVAAESAAYTLAFLGATLGVGALTQNPYLGIMAGVAVTTPAQSQDLYEDLMANGATEEQAANMAVPIGALISSIEVVGGMPVLKAIAPGFFSAFRRNAQKEIAEQAMSSILKKGLTSVGKIELGETLEEVVQGAIQDATVKTINANQDLFANIPETVVRTLLATFPLAILGGGQHVNYLYRQMTAEQKAQVQEDTQKFQAEGMPREQAELLAVNKLQETPEGKAVVEKAIEEVASLPEFQKSVLPSTKGWEKVIWQSIKLEEGKWSARLVGEKSKIILAEREMVIKPILETFKAMTETLKRQKEIRYDPETGKYIKVRKTITRVTKANWDAIPASERNAIAKSAGLAEEVGVKSWEHLTLAEKVTLKTSGITLPEVKEAKVAWDNLSIPERVTIVKAMGMEGKIGSKSWQALDKKEKKLLRDMVISKKIHVTEKEAQKAVQKLIVESVQEQVELTKNPDVVQKLTELIKLAEPMRKITEGLKHEELIKRVGRAAAILDSAEGKEAFEKAKAALRGPLPKAEFTPPELQFDEAEVKQLYNIINDSNLSYFKKQNTADALSTLLSGQIPTNRELKLVEKVFGPELAKAIWDKRLQGTKAWRMTLNILNLPRAFKCMWDLSGYLRQGGILFWGQPKQSIPIMGSMVKAFFSEESARQLDEVIHSSQYAELREEAGLYIAPLFEEHVRLGEREEPWMTEFAKDIPLLRHSERAYIICLNLLRANVFDSYARTWEGTGKTMEDYKKLARAINIMTGRGYLGKLSGMAEILNAIFFSPRYIASRVQMPIEVLTTTPAVRKMMVRNILAWVAGSFAIMGLMAVAVKAFTDEDASMENDPRSADFGKLKIGNTRLDWWVGFQQYARAICQIITGMRKVSTTGKLTKVQRDQILWQFTKGKLSPVAGLVMDILAGETYMGDELSLKPAAIQQQAKERLAPMFIQDMIEAVNDSGIMGGLLALPGLFGVGIQTYGGGYWSEFIDQLGKPIQSETWPYSVNLEDIYDTSDFYSDISRRVSGMKPEDVKPRYGIPELARSVIQAKAVKEVYEERPSDRLTDINADIAKGDTYENYYLQWQEYLKQTTDKEKAAFKEKCPKYYMGNFSHQMLVLLSEYHSLDKIGQDQFLKDHPEIKQNPRIEWLKAHPEENALLAFWGQAKMFTLAAYEGVNELITKLDMPYKAVEYIMPPIDSKENYFKYLDIGEEFGWNSWEIKLLLLEDDQLRQWLGREPIDDNIEALRLQVKNRDLTAEYNGYSEKDSPYFIASKKEQEKAREKFRTDNPDWVKEMDRIDAYKLDLPEEQIEDYVNYYQFPDKGYRRERYLLEHPEFYQSMVDLKGIMPFDFDYRIPNVRYDEIYEEYQDLFEKYDNVTGTEKQREAKREQILADNPNFARARRLREGYDKFRNIQSDAVHKLAEEYAKWFIDAPKKKDDLWFKSHPDETFYGDQWWLMEHPEFVDAMVDEKIWKRDSKFLDFSKVPTKEVFQLYKTYQELPRGTPGFDFRAQHPELDAWLVLAKGFKPISSRGKKEAKPTPWDELAAVNRFLESS